MEKGFTNQCIRDADEMASKPQTLLISGEYKLPEGVYLLLGFSSVDESLLRPHTGLGAEDAVRLLQQYMHTVQEEGVSKVQYKRYIRGTHFS